MNGAKFAGREEHLYQLGQPCQQTLDRVTLEIKDQGYPTISIVSTIYIVDLTGSSVTRCLD